MKNKLFTILITLTLLFSLFGCTPGSASATIEKEVNTAAGEYSGKTVILHSNDSHGAIKGFAIMKAAKKAYEAKGATVILVDAGDFTQGTIYVSTTKGGNATTLMEQAGYDIVGLGNHEFDYGFDQLKQNVSGKSFKVVTNVTENGKSIFNSSVSVKVGDLKIGFFGLLTPETQTKVNPNYVKGLKFMEKQDLYDYAKTETAELKKTNDLVICIAHLGVDYESVGNQSIDVLNNAQKIDFVIDGHSHTVMTKTDSLFPVQQTGTAFEKVGVIVIDNKTKKIEDNFVVNADEFGTDPEVLASAEKFIKDVDAFYSNKFAETKVDLDGVKGNVRSKETNLGDLIADAMKWVALKAGSLEVDDAHVVAVTNGGGIRASINTGDVTMADINTVLPFGNTLAVDYVTGAELLEALEASCYMVPETVGGFPQIAGMEIEIDSTIPFDQGEKYPNSTYFAPKTIKRVTIKSVNGQPFDKNSTYAVITNNFCAAGGDTYYAFLRAFNEGKGFDTGIVLDEAVVDFVSNHLNGVIGEEYATTQGRIVIK